MTMIDPRLAGIGTILHLLASQGSAQIIPDLTAILTQVGGQVTLASESRSGFPSVRRAARRQVIRRGEVVHVPVGAQVTLICSTEALVSLTGPRDFVLDELACGRGSPLPEGSFRNLDSYAGRILPKNGALLLEFETRNAEGGPGPMLLSPRNTAVMDAYPHLVWTQVPDAAEYEIELRGPIETSIRLAAHDLHCGQGSGPWHDLDVCSWAPSSKWPALGPEKPLFLKFGSRQASTAPLRQVREVYQIQLLSLSHQRSVQKSLRQIAALPMDESSRLLLTAGACARSGLYADAIAAYEEALQALEMPEARVTLGDLYLSIGLTALADREYAQVLAGAPDPAAQAAAELGRGYVAYFRKLFSAARAHFERAGELYARIGLPAEAEDARAAVARARGDSRHGSR
jgi:hypothetical protein